jgi:hypothetical protein
MESMNELSSDHPENSSDMAAFSSHQAAHAVFNTNELLCNIIGRLSLENIALATGVCRTWRYALRFNIAIRQILWRAPKGIREIESSLDCLGMRIEDMPTDQFEIIGEINPYISRTCGEQNWTANNVYEDHIDIISRNLFKPPPTRPIGAWAEIFITQPPIETVMVKVYPDIRYEVYGFSSWAAVQRFRFRCVGSITMGKLVDFIQSKVPQHGNAAIKLSIPRGLKLSCDPSAMEPGTHRWEIRNGKVYRQKPTFDDEEEAARGAGLGEQD